MFYHWPCLELLVHGDNKKQTDCSHFNYSFQVLYNPRPCLFSQFNARTHQIDLKPEARMPSQAQTGSAGPQSTCRHVNIETNDCPSKSLCFAIFCHEALLWHSQLIHTMQRNLEFTLKERESPTERFCSGEGPDSIHILETSLLAFAE